MLKQSGFTIIELIVVLILVGVIASIAVPRFVNLSTNSKQAATTSMAAALGSVSSANFAKRTAKNTQGSAVTNCTDIGLLLSGGLPAGYSITSLAISAGSSVNCTLVGQGNTSASFIGMGIT